MNSPAPLFSAARIAAQRDRLMNAPEGADFLKALTAETIIDRLSMVTREFAKILLIGAHDAELVAHLRTLGIVTIIETGPALARKTGATIMDAESADMPMGSFDLIVWPTGLESVNDVPAALVRMRALLAPDGLLLGAFLGDGSLPKLRRAVMTDGIRTVARMHPQIDLSSMGNLLQRVGFALPVVDVDALDVRYGNIFGLVRDLRANGLSSRLSPAPIMPTREEVALMAAAFAAQADPDGRVKEVFRLIHFSGWAPDPSQPKPARRGSATASLAEALKNPPEAAKPKEGGAE